MSAKITLMGTLLVTTLLLNVYSVSDEDVVLNKRLDPSNPLVPGNWDDESDGNGTGDEGGEVEANFTVLVPTRNVGDSMRYDFDLFLEMYFSNTSSGEWDRFTVIGEGELRDKTLAVEKADDSFGEAHQSQNVYVERRLSFTVIIDNNTSDEPFIIEGSGEVFRNTWTELQEGIDIKMNTEGRLDVDQIPRAPVPISFEGSVLSWPNPNDEQDVTLEERVYLDGQTLQQGDEGSWTEPGEVEWLEQTYNWSVTGGRIFRGFKALDVEVKSKWWEFLDFTWKATLCNEAPIPIALYNRINTSWSERDQEGYIIIEQNQTLQPVDRGGYERGDTPVQWADGGSGDFRQNRASAELKDWTYMPVGGNKFDTTGMELRPEDAIQFAREADPEFDEWLKDHRGELVEQAAYNVSLDSLDLNQRAGDYYWNMTFGAPFEPDEDMDWDEVRELWDESEDRYHVVVVEKVRKEGGILGGYTEEMEIFDDGMLGPRQGWASVDRGNLPDRVLTVASAEEIISTYPDAKAELYDRTGQLELEDLAVGYSVWEQSESTMPGMDMFNYLSGIEIPQVDHSWTFQKASVWESGDTYAVSLDAQTGAIVGIVQISGTVLQSLFMG